jgi:tRNA/rRNA methyltransferase
LSSGVRVLDNNELRLCDTMVTIPAANEYPTLNLSHAAAIMFYELNRSAVPVPSSDLASEGVKRTILEYLSRSSAKAGLEEYKIGLTARAFRSVMGRSAIRRREASLLAGVLRQISEALSRPMQPQGVVYSTEQVKLLLEE